MGKIITICLLFVLTFLAAILNGLYTTYKVDKKKGLWRSIYIPLIFSVFTSIVGSFVYDYVRQMWIDENRRLGVLRGNYPYFVEVDEKYGNLTIELEQKGSTAVEGVQISIAYPNSDYWKVMVWNYTGPAYFNIEPMEYEIMLSDANGGVLEKYPIQVYENMNNTVVLPIFQ